MAPDDGGHVAGGRRPVVRGEDEPDVQVVAVDGQLFATLQMREEIYDKMLLDKHFWLYITMLIILS